MLPSMPARLVVWSMAYAIASGNAIPHVYLYVGEPPCPPLHEDIRWRQGLAHAMPCALTVSLGGPPCPVPGVYSTLGLGPGTRIEVRRHITRPSDLLICRCML